MIKSLIKEQRTCYFISPHLDDAILSAGGVISYLAGKVPVKIITVFTRPSSPPETLYAKRFVRACGFDNSRLLFKERKEEDRRVFSQFNIKPMNLDYVDAYWRKKKERHVGLIESLFPELNHIYPTRYHARTGRINSLDFPMIDRLRNELGSLVLHKKAAVFCPFGISHIDHVIVNKVCSELFEGAIYWSDYPYNRKSSKLPINMDVYVWKENSKLKKSLISGYKTQLKPLFGKSTIQIVEEAYYRSRT